MIDDETLDVTSDIRNMAVVTFFSSGASTRQVALTLVILIPFLKKVVVVTTTTVVPTTLVTVSVIIILMPENCMSPWCRVRAVLGTCLVASLERRKTVRGTMAVLTTFIVTASVFRLGSVGAMNFEFVVV